MNHCWRAQKVPVSGWKRDFSAGRLSPPVSRTMDGKTGPDRWSRTGATTLRFWGPWLRVLALNTWVLWSLISRGCAAVAVGVKTLSRPKLNFHWEIEEANMPRARCRTPSFLLLSFNRIRLLIILWTSLRPYFNLLWRPVEIRELLWSPKSLLCIWNVQTFVLL